MAARLGGIKDEKSSWGSEMDNTFLFYFSKMQSHVWISTSIESGLSNCRYIKPYIKFKLLKLAFFINQQFVEKMQNRFFRILYCQCQNQLSKAKTHSNVFFFTNLICSSLLEVKALKKCKCVRVFPFLIAIKSYRTNWKLSAKKVGWSYKNA